VTFPDPRTYDFPEWLPYGDYMYFAREVVSFGDPLTVKNVREAYLKGIFPWHMEGIPLPWYCPEQRAILEFADLHIPRSLERARRSNGFTFTIDKAFRQVMEECSRTPRPGQGGTWITGEFIDVYSQLHNEGMAHSVEAWDAEGELVGGLYGVDAGGVFCGESMFFKKANASKLALLFLIDHLRSRGATWLDAQVMTPHMKALGAKEIDRKRFLDRLEDTQQQFLSVFGSLRNDRET
jgi:leucyl/phenylalanyl-tRNA---protein transferase